SSQTASELSWLEPKLGVCIEVCPPPATWSPDGTKVLYQSEGGGAFVANGDGSSQLLLSESVIDVAPRGSVASYLSFSGPSCASTGFYSLFVLQNLQNLVADFRTERLPGNDGLVIRGTADDRNLDHYVLEYALETDPNTWRPIGTASGAPV